MSYSQFFIQSIKSISTKEQAKIFFEKSMKTSLFDDLFVRIIDYYEKEEIVPGPVDLFNKISALENQEEIDNFFSFFFEGEEYDTYKKRWHDGFGYFKYHLFSHKLLVVLLTNDCNANCNYCKMSERIEGNKHIKINDFSRILDWLDAQRIKMYIMTGGEPTIHPEFDKIVKISRQRGFQTVLNSNFFFGEKVLNSITPDVFYSITVHYNSQYENNAKLMRKFNHNIAECLRKGIHMDIRFVLHDENYTNFLSFVEGLGMNRFTVSFVHPNKLNVNNENNKLNSKKLKKWKKLFDGFVKETEKRKLKFNLLKPLPICMFKEGEHEKYKEPLRLWDTCMDRAELTVTPDLKIMWCNTNIFNPVDSLFNYSSVEEGRSYLKKNIEKYFWSFSSMPECQQCIHYKERKCQGGCLAYRDNEKFPKSIFINNHLEDE